MKKFNLAFIDFDDTLFNSYVFAKDIAAVFMRHGVDAEGHRVAMDRALRGDSVDHYQYSFALHMEKVKELGYAVPDTVLSELNSLLENNYFFEEADFDFETFQMQIAEDVLVLKYELIMDSLFLFEITDDQVGVKQVGSGIDFSSYLGKLYESIANPLSNLDSLNDMLDQVQFF